MNRDHKLITLHITYTVTVYQSDPQAPGSGEMIGAGTQRVRVSHSLKIIATSPRIAEAWAISRYPDVVIKGHTVDDLDAVIETHTY